MEPAELSSVSSWLHWLSVIKYLGGAMVVIGVAAELLGDWFSEPLQKKLDDARKLEIAQLVTEGQRLSKEAAEAKLALEKLRSPRNLSPEQQEDIVTKLKGFGPVNFGMGLLNGGVEPGSKLLEQLTLLLSERLNWKLTPVISPPGSRGQPPPNKGLIAVIGISGVKISFDADHAAELEPIASSLNGSLNAAGINSAVLAVRDGTPNAIFIAIGAKI